MSNKCILFLPIKIDKNYKCPEFIYDKIINYNPNKKVLEDNNKILDYDDSRLFLNNDLYDNESDNENNNYETQHFNVHNDDTKINFTIKHLNNKISKNHLSNIKCFWCCYSFDTNAIYIPLSYKDNHFDVYGNFCSFSCALSYNRKHTDIENMNYRHSLIHLLKSKTLAKRKVEEITFAPDPSLLIDFGGNLTISDFRKLTDQKKNINIIYPPMKVIIPYIEEVNINSKNVLSNDDFILKRKKNKKSFKQKSAFF